MAGLIVFLSFTGPAVKMVLVDAFVLSQRLILGFRFIRRET